MIATPATHHDFARWRAEAEHMTEAELFFAIKDCRSAAEGMKGWNPVREGYYEDQAFTFADELRNRRAQRAA